MVSPTLILGLVLGLVANSQAVNFSTTVDIGYSKYKGVEGSNGVTYWRGIRYAAPPLKDLRFRAPADPIATGDQVLPANQSGPLCIFSPSTQFNASSQSEDCLFLNVFRPTVKKDKLLPVYLYIAAGGLNTLTGSTMDGSRLVAGSDHEIIVMNFNYRVGSWGFLASKEVKKDGDLNVGILDQRKVLLWVQKNIKAFGGDPQKVTLAGASAGAGSLDIHLTAFGGRNDKLFAAAHAESPSFGFVRTISESQYQYDALVARLGCDKSTDTLNCLRQLPSNVIAENNPNLITPGGGGGTPLYMWSNCIDGDLIRDQTYNSFSSGKFIKVPTIYGSNTNEGTGFTPSAINNYTDVGNFLRNNFPKLTKTQLSQIAHLYPKAEQFPGRGPYWRTAANFYGDMRYACPSKNVSATLFAAGEHATYNYHWDVLTPENAENGLGVPHISGIQPIWGLSPAGSSDAVISPYIQRYITSFVRTVGNPNAFRKQGAPNWRAYEGRSMQRMWFPNDPKMVGMQAVGPKIAEQCKYLSGIGPSIGQ